MMANIDLAPTILDYADTAAPAAMQGFSRRAALAGRPQARREEVYFRYWMHLAHRHDNPAHYGIRTERWKLLFFYGLALDATGAIDEASRPAWELYDMRSDPQELHNLYGKPEVADVTAELKTRLARVKHEIGDDDERYPALLARLRETP